MGRYHEAFWEPDPTQLSRRGRRGGPYKWYEPTRLSELDLALSGDVVSDVLRAEDALAAMKGNVYGADAAIIGEVVATRADRGPKVYVRNSFGGRRILDMLVGEQLPRIC